MHRRRLADGDLRDVARECRAGRLNHNRRGGLGIGPQDEGDVGVEKAEVLEQHVARRSGGIGQCRLRDVADHADDAFAGPVEGLEHVSDRVFSRKELRRQRFVDDRHPLRPGTIRRVEIAAEPERHAERCEVVMAHHTERGARRLDIRTALNHEAPVVAGAAQRKLLRRAGGSDARD